MTLHFEAFDAVPRSCLRLNGQPYVVSTVTTTADGAVVSIDFRHLRDLQNAMPRVSDVIVSGE